MRTDQEVEREAGVHGKDWAAVHHGYFADANVAHPLVETVIREAVAGRPDVLADLGGGTGFLLGEIRRAGICARHLVNLDLSREQISQDVDDGIRDVNMPLDRTCRLDLCDDGLRLMLIMRSVLHYFGRDGLDPALSHIRSLANEGEKFIHQTACFARASDADKLNWLYETMGTGKWYPTVEFLAARLEAAGWTVDSVVDAPALPLNSRDLALRYSLSEGAISTILSQSASRRGNEPGVFEVREEGFLAHLHYHIFVCTAI